MKCKNCGKEVDDGYKYCPYCGADLKDTYDPTTSPYGERPNSVNGNPQYIDNNISPTVKKVSYHWKLTIILNVIMYVAMVAFFFTPMFKNASTGQILAFSSGGDVVGGSFILFFGMFCICIGLTEASLMSHHYISQEINRKATTRKPMTKFRTDILVCIVMSLVGIFLVILGPLFAGDSDSLKTGLIDLAWGGVCEITIPILIGILTIVLSYLEANEKIKI